MGESKTSPRRLLAAEKHAQALHLRLGGATFDEIAHALGYAGKAGAYRAVDAAMKLVPAPDAAEYRKLNLERLNRLRLHNDAGIRKGDTRSINAELSIQDREARYLGLDAPTKTDNVHRGNIGIIIERVRDDDPEPDNEPGANRVEASPVTAAIVRAAPEGQGIHREPSEEENSPSG